MRSKDWIWAMGLLAIGCGTEKSQTQVVSQQFIHKYGFPVSKQEWHERSHEGQVISTLENGVIFTRTFENGKLHGITSYTFPHSNMIEKQLTYDQGELSSEIVYDDTGVPVQEKKYDWEGRMVLTLWDHRGAPLSIEEFVSGVLQDAKYYADELESTIAAGSGTRVKRNRDRLLLSRDRIEQGEMTQRINYHANGEVQSISHYVKDQLDGEQTYYSPTGIIVLTRHWDHGVLQGWKTLFRNGLPVTATPYHQGKKHGTERHYDCHGELIAETQWVRDQKHGYSRHFGEETTEVSWFYRGQLVDEEKFSALEYSVVDRTPEEIYDEARHNL